MADRDSGRGPKRSVAEERAAAQEAARRRKAERREAEASAAQLPGDPTPKPGGLALVRFDLWSTAVFTVLAIVATVLEPSSGAGRDAALVWFVALSVALGAVGVGFFVLALVWGAQRSRTAELTMAGWWFLVGDVAPRRVRSILLGCLGLQVVISFVAAGVRPFTELAFGTLVPICSLAIGGAWAAKYGDFPPRRGVTR